MGALQPAHLHARQCDDPDDHADDVARKSAEDPRVEREPQTGGVVITVSDEGIGIPPAELDLSRIDEEAALAEAARAGVRRFVYLSTLNVYGDLTEPYPRVSLESLANSRP